MKKIVALFLCLATLLSLAACGSTKEELVLTGLDDTAETVTEEKETLTETAETVTEEEIPTVEEIDTYDYPEVCDKLSWEKINSFPIANSSMSTDELRKLCVDFFRFTKTFAWTPNDTYNFQKNEKGSKDVINKGEIYGGLPYVGLGSGSVYRVMDYYDPETGVLDIKNAGKDRYLFGNQCSIGAYWGWGRVINSAKYRWTYDAVVANGFIRVGPYTYADNKEKFDSFSNTVFVCNNNGEQTMYESYALLKPADGLVYYTSAGHIIMCASDAVVVRNADGTINGEESYILQIDQSQSWKERDQSNGDKFKVKTGVDTKRTFKKLFEDHYIPFTFAEFLGTDPVEDAVCTFNHSKETITVKELSAGIVTANYGISDIYLTVKDENGTELYKAPLRSKQAGKTEFEFDSFIVEKTWNKYTNGKNTLEITVQLSNGTRPTVYTGKLVAE